MVRLGQGVDRTGRLADEALERAFAAIDEYAALIAEHDVSRIRFCATSATRDSSNGEVFADGVQARLGVRPEVLTGDEEAALAYDGAVRHLPDAAGRAGAGDRHRRRLDRADPRPVRAGRGVLHGHRVGADARAAPALRPADRGRDRSLRGRHRGRPRRLPGRPGRRGDGGRGRGHDPLGRWPGRSTCRRTTATSSTSPSYPSPTCSPSSTAWSRCPWPSGSPCRGCTRPRGRDRRRRAGPRRGSCAVPASTTLRRLRGRHPRRDRLVDGRVTAHPLGAFDVGRAGHGPCMSDPTTRTTDEPLGALVHRLSRADPGAGPERDATGPGRAGRRRASAPAWASGCSARPASWRSSGWPR